MRDDADLADRLPLVSTQATRDVGMGLLIVHNLYRSDRLGVPQRAAVLRRYACDVPLLIPSCIDLSRRPVIPSEVDRLAHASDRFVGVLGRYCFRHTS